MRPRTLLACIILSTTIAGCDPSPGSADKKDQALVNKQQSHYSTVQPLPYFEFSIPRDILIQIYNVVTQEARSTYTIIESFTGVTKFHGPSLGYGIPADTSLTNPVQMARWYSTASEGVVIEQAEPNGLFSSKNTDGTWVLFVDANGDITPIYTEHKVTTFPFAVKRDGGGGWTRADNKRASLTVTIKK